MAESPSTDNKARDSRHQVEEEEKAHDEDIQVNGEGGTLTTPEQVTQRRETRKRKDQQNALNEDAGSSTNTGNRDFPKSANQLGNRYDASSKAPFIVYITFREAPLDPGKRPRMEKNIGNLHPMSVGMRLRTRDANVQRVKRVGANLIQVTYDSYKEANSLVEKQATWLEPSWLAYIPDYKVTRIGIGKGIKENLSEEKIRRGIDWEGKEIKILKIERFTRTKVIDGVKERVPTNTVKFTFHGQDLPDELLIYKNSIKIEPFIPRIKTCTNCQRVGHLKWNCRGKIRCNKCGEDHDIKNCKATRTKCANCGGDHNANDENCHIIQQSKIINLIAAHRNMDTKEAIKTAKSQQLTTIKETREWINREKRQEGWLVPCQPTLNDWFPTIPRRKPFFPQMEQNETRVNTQNKDETPSSRGNGKAKNAGNTTRRKIPRMGQTQVENNNNYMSRRQEPMKRSEYGKKTDYSQDEPTEDPPTLMEQVSDSTPQEKSGKDLTQEEIRRIIIGTEETSTTMGTCETDKQVPNLSNNMSKLCNSNNNINLSSEKNINNNLKEILNNRPPHSRDASYYFYPFDKSGEKNTTS